MTIFSGGWKEQNLIRHEDVVQFLQNHLVVDTHPLPEGMVGNLWCVSGIAQAANAIMDFLEERARYEREKAERAKNG